MVKSLKLAKDELFQLLEDFNCSNNTNTKCLKFDFMEPSEDVIYFTNYIDFINSLHSIDLIKVFLESNKNCVVKNIEVNIFCNIDKTRKDNFSEYTGQQYRFYKKRKNT